MKKVMTQNKVFLIIALIMLIACQLAFIGVRRASSIASGSQGGRGAVHKHPLKVISGVSDLRIVAAFKKAKGFQRPTIQKKMMTHPSAIGPSYLIGYDSTAYTKPPIAYFSLAGSTISISTSFVRVAKLSDNGHWIIIPSWWHKKSKLISVQLKGSGQYALVEWLRMEQDVQKKSGNYRFRIVQYVPVQQAGIADEYIPNANLYLDPAVDIVNCRLTEGRLLDARYISSWKALGNCSLDTLRSTASLKRILKNSNGPIGIQLTLNGGGKLSRLITVKKYLPEN